jgi:two-component system OmpR family response regulator
MANSSERLRVLVVDDVSSVRSLLCRLLDRAARDETDSPLEFIEANEGEQALAVLAEIRVDLIFLDLMMPRMDGFAFLEAHRTTEHACTAPVVVCCGLVDVEALERARKLGVRELLPKPYDTEAVRGRLRGALEERNQNAKRASENPFVSSCRASDEGSADRALHSPDAP